MPDDWKCPADRFPIMCGEGYGRRKLTVPMAIVMEHEGQAQTNHGQSVARLKERGGLSWCELYAVLHGRKWQRIDTDAAHEACMRTVLIWQNKARREAQAAEESKAGA